MTCPAEGADPATSADSVPYGSADPVPSGKVLLEVTDLRVTFGRRRAGNRTREQVRAVRGMSYSLSAGEVLGIVGESGSGKSVSSLAVMGLLPPGAHVTGSARLRGRELLGLPDRAAARIRGREIAMVFQDPLSALTPVIPVGDQIAEAVSVHQRLPRASALDRAVELLDLVGIPYPRRRAAAFPHEFSGGMRQRVMIAMAIANDPDILIADEPTTALDVTVQAQVLDVLRTAQRETGAAIVLITHDLGVVAGLADRVIVMYAGRPVEAGSVDDIYYRPRMPYTMGLLGSVPRLDGAGSGVEQAPLVPIPGSPPSPEQPPAGCAFSPRCPIVTAECRTAEPPLLPPAAGAGTDTGAHLAACLRSAEIVRRGLTVADIFPRRSTGELPPPPIPRKRRPVVLEADDLTRHHPLLRGKFLKRVAGAVRAVDGISLDIRQGETLGLVGESGSGKSTALLEILRLATPQRGQVRLFGKDVADLGVADRTALRREIQVVFQDPLAALDPRLPVGQIVAEPLRAHRYPSYVIEPRVRELLGLVGLEPAHAARFPHSFSGGQRQRIGIARALALQPRLLVLDEPVSALDVSVQAGVINLLDELKTRLGLSYLFVAHDLAVVRHLADRVAVMYLGRIAETGAVSAIYQAPAHPYTQALLSAIPIPDPRRERQRRRIILRGEMPSPADPPSGCRFRTRCPTFADLGETKRRRCAEEEPTVRAIGSDHGVACHFPEAGAGVEPLPQRPSQAGAG